MIRQVWSWTSTKGVWRSIKFYSDIFFNLFLKVGFVSLPLGKYRKVSPILRPWWLGESFLHFQNGKGQKQYVILGHYLIYIFIESFIVDFFPSLPFTVLMLLEVARFWGRWNIQTCTTFHFVNAKSKLRKKSKSV